MAQNELSGQKAQSKSAATSSNALTIAQHCGHILPRLLDEQLDPPTWPPDVFAVAASLLHKTGAYCHAIQHWPPALKGAQLSIADWNKHVRVIAKEWRLEWIKSRGTRVPPEIKTLWEGVISAFSITTQQLRACSDMGIDQANTCRTTQLLLELCVMADEACESIGIVGYPPPYDVECDVKEGVVANTTEARQTAILEHRNEERFYAEGNKVLTTESLTGATLCKEVDSSRARVLPKLHTPQNGLTIRSLSQHLALSVVDDIVPKWVTSVQWGSHLPRNNKFLNLLVVPWPKQVFPAQFATSQPDTGQTNILPKNFGLFTFEPSNPNAQLQVFIQKLIAEAEMTVGRVDAVIMPELAIEKNTLNVLQHYFEKPINPDLRRPFLITGAADDAAGSANKVVCVVPGLQLVAQSKHHRWKLDRSQVEQYGLGAQLHPELFWWEHIAITDRRLTFLSFLPWLVMTVLICEDLARPDPVGDLIRAVGPNLVIALLMDGPQIRERWSARYATTLADDPGCSVLSLTSLGMSRLSRPKSGMSRSRTIGLWKDVQSTSPIEIELAEGEDAVLLTLTARYFEEFTADGRSDFNTTVHPVLSGVHPITIHTA